MLGSKKQGMVQECLAWGYALVASLMIVSLLYLFVIRPVRVDGSSMLPTLNNNDYVMIVPTYDSAQVGNIVVLQSKDANKNLYVKRIVATQGQQVDIEPLTGKLLVDGQPVDDSYTLEPNYTRGDVPFPQTVKEGFVFVMGDNRNHSTDSRFSSLGQVKLSDLEGKVIFRITPIDKFGKVK